MQMINLEIIAKGEQSPEQIPSHKWAFAEGKEFGNIEKVSIMEESCQPSGLPGIQFVIKLSNNKYIVANITGALLNMIAIAAEDVANKTGKSFKV